MFHLSFRGNAGVEFVRVPGWFVIFDCLISPNSPVVTTSAAEQFKIWTPRAAFNDLVLFIRFSGVFSLARADQVDLASARRERACVLALDSEQKHLSYISKIKPDASTIGAAVFSHFMPNDVRLVLETPRVQYAQPIRQQGVRHPQIAMGDFVQMLSNRKFTNFLESHRRIACQAPMFRRDFSGTICKPPWRVGHDRRKPSGPKTKP